MVENKETIKHDEATSGILNIIAPKYNQQYKSKRLFGRYYDSQEL